MSTPPANPEDCRLRLASLVTQLVDVQRRYFEYLEKAVETAKQK